MSATKQQQPQRIQRKRVKGYHMQKESMALNGLPAQSVTRPGPWGNPYTVDEYGDAAIELFEFDLMGYLDAEPNYLEPLRGKNLACFCPLDSPCHADVLLKWANSKVSQ